MTNREGNMIIALYDDWVDEETTTYVTGVEGLCNVYRKKDYSKRMVIEQCPYKHSWNHLIPVVKKLQQELVSTQKVINVYHRDICRMTINKALVELDIDKLWEVTVEGIELLNKPKI